MCTKYRWPNRPARPTVGTARQAQLTKRAVRRRAAIAAQARPVRLLVVSGRPGGTMIHLSILYNLAKKCVVVETQTHNLVYKRLKCIHLASAAAVLLCYMLNSYT
jgi:hypothetical protein